MTTFTNKELIKEIKERISSLEVRDDIERRAYEIALVSLEVEPDEREAYELFMEKRFGDLVDRRRAKNGDNEYMAWDMTLGWIIWQQRAGIHFLFSSATHQANFVCPGCPVRFFGTNHLAVTFGGLLVQGDDFFPEPLCAGQIILRSPLALFRAEYNRIRMAS